MKKNFVIAALAAIMALGAALPAAAHEGDRRGDRDGYRDNFRRAEITIRNDGRTFSVNRGDRMFYRLLDRPFGFRPGLTYAYTDRCNRAGCVVFVFDGWSRRPIDRIFAPHLPMPRYAWRENAGFDRNFRGYGRYERDDRGWNNDDDRRFREGRGHEDRDQRWDERDRDDRDPRWDRQNDRNLDGAPRR